VIETERLRLRPLTDDDLDPLHRELYSDPEVTWDGSTFTRDEAREGLDAKRRHLEEHGFGMLAVTDKRTGEFLGWGGLQHMEGGPDIELGYYLARKAWGRGYATELSRAWLEFGFSRLGLRRVVAVVRPGNEASRRVLAKVGFTFVAGERHYGEDVELWEARSTTSAE
jgi:ribosomal-protein-alanine N-acetyltransferase